MEIGWMELSVDDKWHLLTYFHTLAHMLNVGFDPFSLCIMTNYIILTHQGLTLKCSFGQAYFSFLDIWHVHYLVYSIQFIVASKVPITIMALFLFHESTRVECDIHLKYTYTYNSKYG